MKAVYIVYEIDQNMMSNTFVLKVLTTKRKVAKTFFNNHKKEYKKDYKLVFGYIAKEEFNISSNLQRDINIIKLSF